MTQLVWLITGCSSGIGKALANKVLERGDRVVATARAPVERLKPLEDAGATILELDVTASQETLNAVVDKAIDACGRIDVVVPNAGHIDVSMAEEKS
jgi:NAD(P)-dependent dehydrogenase (short-subunit alcohol dehydrogenase family)